LGEKVVINAMKARKFIFKFEKFGGLPAQPSFRLGGAETHIKMSFLARIIEASAGCFSLSD
jgi:hypothetical protein